MSLNWQASEVIDASLAIDYADTAEMMPALVLLDIFYTDPTAGGTPNIAGLHSIFGFDARTVPYDQRFIIGDNVSLSHRFSDEFMLYGYYATGFKSGGFTGRTVAFIPDQTPIPFNEEEAATVEFGTKTDFWNNRVRVNAALFRTAYEDLQLVIQSGVAPITANAGEATINGLELDLTARFSENFTASATLGLLDGKYNQKPVQVGDNLVNSPKTSIGVGLKYSVSLRGGS